MMGVYWASAHVLRGSPLENCNPTANSPKPGESVKLGVTVNSVVKPLPMVTGTTKVVPPAYAPRKTPPKLLMGELRAGKEVGSTVVVVPHQPVRLTAGAPGSRMIPNVTCVTA